MRQLSSCTSLLLLATAVVINGPQEAEAETEVARADTFVQSNAGIQLFVRQVTGAGTQGQNDPVLLLHGARVGGLASFDVDVNGMSLAENLAEAGYTVYIADLRGFGASSFPEEMSGERFEVPVLVRTEQAVEDVKAVLDYIADRHGDAPISAFGWATGSHWLAATEATYPGSIDRLVFYNSVYGGEGDWRLTGLFSVEGQPAEFNYEKFGGYRTSDAASLVGRWTEAEGVSEAFIEAYVELAMSGDMTRDDRDPPSFRHPSGPIADTLLAVHEGPLYDAGSILSVVLILRSENDFWSRPVDVESMQADLWSASSVSIQELSGASHYVHLEEGEQRNAFFEILTDYLSDGALDGVGAQSPSGS